MSKTLKTLIDAILLAQMILVKYVQREILTEKTAMNVLINIITQMITKDVGLIVLIKKDAKSLMLQPVLAPFVKTVGSGIINPNYVLRFVKLIIVTYVLKPQLTNAKLAMKTIITSKLILMITLLLINVNV